MFMFFGGLFLFCGGFICLVILTIYAIGCGISSATATSRARRESERAQKEYEEGHRLAMEEHERRLKEDPEYAERDRIYQSCLSHYSAH